MLPRINRIRKKKDFEIIFKNGKSLKANLFILKVMENSLGINRVGFVVSQKVSKRAVVRNLARRRLSEAISAEMENIKNGIDLVFIALSGIDKKEFSEIKEVVHNALLKTKLIRI